ncbi:uncharacterized protein LOC133896134 [Phragmites australis]|uniref:uncharacterized protein LOC133896134 n=1 Tax=Phragmites australis TaxID=29695 RepID=UPI002D791C84|nr:uncharacterized protein LOC133896134 [Phragmites australis]
MPSSEVPGEVAWTRTTQVNFCSDVWRDFDYNASDSATGGAATATCKICGTPMCAGSKNGTSHLRRHQGGKRCMARAAARRLAAPDAAAEPSPGDHDYSMVTADEEEQQDEEEGFMFVDGMNIVEVYDELMAMGLVDIDQGSAVVAAPDAHFPANYMPVSQAANSSTGWFLEKQRRKAESQKRLVLDKFSQDVPLQ